MLTWTGGAEIVGYDLNIAAVGAPQPPSLWVEWGERSNNLFDGIFFGCDGKIRVLFGEVDNGVNIHGDAAFSFEGGDFVLGLDPSVIHTYRFESLDGVVFRFSVDGQVFFEGTGASSIGRSDLQFGGFGSCSIDEVNEWDFVRYGTIGGGEQMVSVDPPPGNLTASEGAQFRSLVITFDQPAYLYNDDITLTTTGGTPPTIKATRRPDNSEPEVLEVFINGSLPPGQTTTFTFDTGTGPQSISYNRDQPEIPATSAWGVIAAALLALVVATIMLPRHNATR